MRIAIQGCAYLEQPSCSDWTQLTQGSLNLMRTDDVQIFSVYTVCLFIIVIDFYWLAPVYPSTLLSKWEAVNRPAKIIPIFTRRVTAVGSEVRIPQILLYDVRCEAFVKLTTLEVGHHTFNMIGHLTRAVTIASNHRANVQAVSTVSG